MARLHARRVLRYVLLLIAILYLYFLFTWREKNTIDPIKSGLKRRLDTSSLLLRVDEFWVPEKALDRENNGPGERGRPVVTSDEEKELRNKAYGDYGFNQFVSDKISLNRTIPDTRPSQ